MTTGAAEITQNARGQRRRSVPNGENVPSGACGRGLRHCSQGSARVWGVENLLVEAPRRNMILGTADGSRQRAVIWEMSA